MSNPTDEVIAVLRKIEAVGGSLETRARWIKEDVDALVHRPGWQTKAEDALVQAEHQLKRALSAVQGARKLYVRKPIAA